MNYNELTPVQKHVVRAMHYIWLSKRIKKSFIQLSPVETLTGDIYSIPEKLLDYKYNFTTTGAWIWKRAYQNECLRLAEIPKKIPGYTNERARREAKVVVDYVRGEYRRMNSGLSKIS